MLKVGEDFHLSCQGISRGSRKWAPVLFLHEVATSRPYLLFYGTRLIRGADPEWKAADDNVTDNKVNYLMDKATLDIAGEYMCNNPVHNDRVPGLRLSIVENIVTCAALLFDDVLEAGAQVTSRCSLGKKGDADVGLRVTLDGADVDAIVTVDANAVSAAFNITVSAAQEIRCEAVGVDGVEGCAFGMAGL